MKIGFKLGFIFKFVIGIRCFDKLMWNKILNSIYMWNCNLDSSDLFFKIEMKSYSWKEIIAQHESFILTLDIRKWLIKLTLSWRVPNFVPNFCVVIRRFKLSIVYFMFSFVWCDGWKPINGRAMVRKFTNPLIEKESSDGV
jgi:hypothetical protein